jgi:DnaJ-domain-containing protein 1
MALRVAFALAYITHFPSVDSMSDPARPDLLAFMDAYKVLGVEYSADSSEIRGVHRRLARLHHPDRSPAGSPEQQEATVRMAQINDAYRLVREAPLRYHRVSSASDPDTPWQDAELDEAIRRARTNRDVDLVITIGLVVVALFIVPIFVSSLTPAVARTGSFQMPLAMALTLGVSFVMWSLLGSRMWHTLIKVELALMVLQQFMSLSIR